MTADAWFQNLKRPASPNHWLLAPAGFVAKPDAVAPVFDAPVASLRDAFKAVALDMKGTEIASASGHSLHIVATTSVMKFKDDIHVQFIAVAPDKSTLAVYSASRVGYWDLGVNRRRVTDWVARTQSALAQARK